MKNYQVFGSLLLRVILGFTFFMHGLAKFQGGIENTVTGFQGMGLPGILAYVVATIELIGGIALILGAGTRIVSVLMAFIMMGVILFVKFGAGFLSGYEFEVVLLVIALHLALNGSTQLSLDAKLSQIKSLSSRNDHDKSIRNERTQ